MSENKLLRTNITNINNTFLPLIMDQMDRSSLTLTAYSRQCVLSAISAMNSIMEKAGVPWHDEQLDKSTVVDVLMKVAALQLNAAANPREVFFQLRNVKFSSKDKKDVWKKQIEMGIEGDGNDALLARFGRNVDEVGQIWKVRENDEFTYPAYNGLDMTPPKWTPKGNGKITRIVYPVIKRLSSNQRVVEFYISERADVLTNLLAHISNNLIQETFGYTESKYKANAEQREKIAARRKELLDKARSAGLEKALDDPELQPWISPAWTDYHSREAMIERKMRNNAIKKIPKDFGNGALETLFEEATDEVYRATAREIAAHANGEPLDLDSPDAEKDPEPENTDASQSIPDPLPEGPQNGPEPPEPPDGDEWDETPPQNVPEPAYSYNPGF